MRRKLVEKLLKKGIKDENVLAAIATIPRHFFMEKAFVEWAYEDKAFPIAKKQTISQPYTVAFQTTLLELKKREKILEVGTGSGYQAAVLASLGARVYTIERQEELYKKSNQLLSQMGYGNIRCFFRDGYKGLAEFAPFDKILVTAGASEIPKKLLDQLAIGGILVAPIGKGKIQKMYKIQKITNTKFKRESFGDFRFVPFLKGLNKD